MKKTQVIAALLGAAAVVAVAAPKDPVLMSIAGHKVPLSEFEYLRNKNNTQQQQPQSLDEYVKMFVDYKLKVAAAEAAGIDTTAKFRNEYEQFRNDLANPYLRNASVEEALIQEAYGHTLEQVTVSHIMLSQEDAALADSLRQVILSGTDTFEDVARKYSIDRGSKARGGLMGTVVPMRFPWAFEKASYDTPVHGISDVVNSGVGYHIIRVESRQPAKGEVEASHILRLTRGKSADEATAQKATIDSLYLVVTAPGADFADVAKRYSEDPGSAVRGGALGYFMPGMMVQPFDSIAFALEDGQISRPFKTSFGWHIINRTGHKAPASLDEMRDNIKGSIERDERSVLPRQAFVEDYIAKHKGSVDTRSIDRLVALVPAAGLDSASMAAIRGSKLVAYKLGKEKATFAEIIGASAINLGESPAAVRAHLDDVARTALENRALDQARKDLAADNSEYRNLVNEYRDGILLYEISNEKVWDRAAKDKAGLEAYFKSHADKYKWDAPKFKSIVIFAPDDSTLNVALAYADSLDVRDPAKFVEDMRHRFGRDVKVERVIAAKGENAITDYLAFGGEKPAVEANQRWKVYSAYKGRIIEAPEEAADVRGLAVTDYQAELEKEWLDALRREFKVEIDSKVLDTLR